MPQLERVLISNRGEIAIRIVKAASALGMESVGVYPAADSLSLHTRLATSAVQIGNGAADDPVAAYLDAEALVAAAQRSGCDCVHPGYGFLAENADFAQRCTDAELAFVGPPPAALSLFGDKVRSRQLAASLDIPVVPGSDDPVPSASDAADLAGLLGYPVMLKAAAGGGGRGMRKVTSADSMARRSPAAEARPKPRSAVAPCSSRSSSSVLVTSKSRFLPMGTATSSTCTSGTAPSSCAIRR